MKIEISEATFKRLQSVARPLVDSVEDVIVRLLDAYEEAGPQIVYSSNPFLAVPREPLYGFRKQLWDLVIKTLPIEFSLDDVYKHQGPLRKERPHVQELEASIRNAMQRLRDMGYVEFVARGEYRRIEETFEE